MIASVLGPQGTKRPLEIGERWAYRERARDLGEPMIQAEVVQFPPPRTKSVRIRYIDGPFPDLMEWVPRLRLLVPWDEAADLLRDENRLASVRAAARRPADPRELEAANEVVYAHLCSALQTALVGGKHAYFPVPEKFAKFAKLAKFARFAIFDTFDPFRCHSPVGLKAISRYRCVGATA